MKGDDITARLVALAVRVVKIVDALPDTLARRHVAGQLLRSGTSPGANYEEARGAERRRDFLHKVGIALKELQETRYWLRVVAGANLAPSKALHEILPQVEALCRILGSSKRTASLNRAAPQGGDTGAIRRAVSRRPADRPTCCCVFLLVSDIAPKSPSRRPRDRLRFRAFSNLLAAACAREFSSTVFTSRSAPAGTTTACGSPTCR
ncbi:MAG TPA: four helix bundle protein [Candidatus Margulisiibacteriota bacterium]|nr:four helix bundle protein [Candidatus Margulisiibacteriota bacterium]